MGTSRHRTPPAPVSAGPPKGARTADGGTLKIRKSQWNFKRDAGIFRMEGTGMLRLLGRPFLATGDQPPARHAEAITACLAFPAGTTADIGGGDFLAVTCGCLFCGCAQLYFSIPCLVGGKRRVFQDCRSIEIGHQQCANSRALRFCSKARSTAWCRDRGWAGAEGFPKTLSQVWMRRHS